MTAATNVDSEWGLNCYMLIDFEIHSLKLTSKNCLSSALFDVQGMRKYASLPNKRCHAAALSVIQEKEQ